MLLALAPCLARAAAATALPHITSVTPFGGQRGASVDLTIRGAGLSLGAGLIFEGTGVAAESVAPEPTAKGKEPAPNAEWTLHAKVRVAPDAPLGVRAMRVLTSVGPSDVAWFVVGSCPEIVEHEPNNARATAQNVTLPITVNGRIDPAQDVDAFRFHAVAGQTLVFDLRASQIGSPLDPVLTLQDASGREIATHQDLNGADPAMIVRIPAAGDYFLLVRDLRYQGSGSHTYRLTMGAVPYVTGVFPLGGRPGTSLDLDLAGYNLGRGPSGRVTIPPDASPGPMPVGIPFPAGESNPVLLAAGDAPERVDARPSTTATRAEIVPVPVTVNGRLLDPASARNGNWYRFQATRGRKLLLEVVAQRLGSALDSVLTVTDLSGKVLAANDDAVGRDSRLEFAPPKDGLYAVRIVDLHGRSGREFAYRLALRVVKPDFALAFIPDRLAVGRGGRVALTVMADRSNGFDGQISLELAGLPPGVKLLGPARIPPGRAETTLVAAAALDAAIESVALRVTGAATIDGAAVRRSGTAIEEVVQADQPTTTRPMRFPVAAVTAPPDLVLEASPEKLLLAPGKTVEVTVKIARRPGFTAAVPLVVLGLPDGVTATAPDIGEKASEGKVTLKADDKARAGTGAVVITGKIDGGVLQAALPIEWTVVAAAEKKRRR